MSHLFSLAVRLNYADNHFLLKQKHKNNYKTTQSIEIHDSSKLKIGVL